MAVYPLQPSLQTVDPLQRLSLQSTRIVTGSCRGSTALQHSTALYSTLSSTALYSIHPLQSPSDIRILEDLWCQEFLLVRGGEQSPLPANAVT